MHRYENVMQENLDIRMLVYMLYQNHKRLQLRTSDIIYSTSREPSQPEPMAQTYY